MNYTEWVKERGCDCYCPFERETGRVVTGLTLIGYPKGEVVGEFYYDENGELRVEFYEGKKTTNDTR